MEASCLGVVTNLNLCVWELSEFLNGFYIRCAHVGSGDNTELTAILRKLSQLVHNEPQATPFDEGHQHINSVSRDDLFLELRKHLRLVNGPSKQRTLGNRCFRPLYVRRSFSHSQPRIRFP